MYITLDLVSRVMYIMRDGVCDAKILLTPVDAMPIYLTLLQLWEITMTR